MLKRAVSFCCGTIKEFLSGMAERRLATYAASCAFFTFLSIIPLLLLVCAILSRTHISIEQAFLLLGDFLPDGTIILLHDLLEDMSSGSGVLLPISLVITLWSAGKGVSALMRGVESAYDDRRDAFLKNRITASVITLLLIIVFIALMVVAVLVNQKGLSQFILKMAVVLGSGFIVSLFYMLIPEQKRSMWMHMAGGYISVLAVYCFSLVYKLYIIRFGRYSGYGTFGTIIATLLWIYYIMYIILAGAYLNRYIELRAERRRRG